ncbi:MAG: phosphotransferase family protein [Ardenticatenaceae bacterium]
MFCNIIEIATREGVKPEGYTILAMREDHLVARLETAFGPMVFKADLEPKHTADDAINIERLGSANIPVPTVVAQGEEPVSYIILNWIEGEPLTVASPLKAQQEAGRLLRRIHYLENRPAYARPYPWDGWMKGWLDVALPWWGEQDCVSAQMVDAAWRGFEALRPLLATRGQHYMLQDGRPEHFLVQGERIVGLIDVHDAQAGDAGMDLGVIGVAHEQLLANMRMVYAVEASEDEMLDQLVPFYIFLRRLAAAEWNMKHGSTEIASRALAQANAHPLK